MSNFDQRMQELDVAMRALGRPRPPVVAWLANGRKGDFAEQTAAWKAELVKWEAANPVAAVEWVELRQKCFNEEEAEEAKLWSVDEFRYRLLERLGVPQRCVETIRREFLDTPNMQAANAWCRDGNQWCLTLCGAVGGGKTTAAAWAAHQLMMRARRVQWVRCARMVDAPMFGVEAEFLKHQCREAGVLVLDDIGAGAREESAKPWLGWLDDILDARWGAQRRTIITSNLGAGPLAKWLGMRLADRINEGLIHEDSSKSLRGTT